MTNPLVVLAHLDRFQERDIQNALVELWPCISLRYPLLVRPNVIMPDTWAPDLVAVNNYQNECLVIELKGIPPAGPAEQALRQLLRYATELQDVYKALYIRPVLIGPYVKWGPIHRLHRKRFDVSFVSIRRLSQYLLDAAAESLKQAGRESVQDALGCLDVLFVEQEEMSSEEAQ